KASPPPAGQTTNPSQQALAAAVKGWVTGPPGNPQNSHFDSLPAGTSPLNLAALPDGQFGVYAPDAKNGGYKFVGNMNKAMFGARPPQVGGARGAPAANDQLKARVQHLFPIWARLEVPFGSGDNRGGVAWGPPVNAQVGSFSAQLPPGTWLASTTDST